jgi:hypothetical protein
MPVLLPVVRLDKQQFANVKREYASLHELSNPRRAERQKLGTRRFAPASSPRRSAKAIDFCAFAMVRYKSVPLNKFLVQRAGREKPRMWNDKDVKKSERPRLDFSIPGAFAVFNQHSGDCGAVDEKFLLKLAVECGRIRMLGYSGLDGLRLIQKSKSKRRMHLEIVSRIQHPQHRPGWPRRPRQNLLGRGDALPGKGDRPPGAHRGRQHGHGF